MKAKASPQSHRTAKGGREIRILLSLVDLYIRTGKPIASATLQETEFTSLSSATIRGDFAKLEASGFLKQLHTSGGRTPTDSAFKLFAMHHLGQGKLDKKQHDNLKLHLEKTTKEVALYLEETAAKLSQLTGCATFISAPRFDQDVIRSMRLIEVDEQRYLAVIITDFGIIHTETLKSPRKLSHFAVKRIENYFQARLKMTPLFDPLEEDEEQIAKDFYSEMMLRHIVGYNHFTHEDLYKAGFSKLLTYPEMQDASALAASFSLFENQEEMCRMLRECCRLGEIKCWIGDDLGTGSVATVIAIPYAIGHKVAGAIALLGPTRCPYPRLFALLKSSAEIISNCLTKNLYKYRLTFREADKTKLGGSFLQEGKGLLLEDQRENA